MDSKQSLTKSDLDRDEFVDMETRRLRQDIEATRAHLGDTLSELGEKLKPANLVEENIKEPLRAKAAEIVNSVRSGVANGYAATCTFMDKQGAERPATLGLACLGIGVAAGLLVPQLIGRNDYRPSDYRTDRRRTDRRREDRYS